MKIKFAPKTRSGKWAVRFGIFWFIVTVISIFFAFAIGGDAAVVKNNSLLSIFAALLSVLFTVTGPLSFFTGVFAVIKHKDRTVARSLTVLYGSVLLLFLLGEFLFPH